MTHRLSMNVNNGVSESCIFIATNDLPAQDEGHLGGRSARDVDNAL